MLGYFGDGIVRKFGDEPPVEWIEAIAEINDYQIRRGFKRLAFGWKGGIPNLPDFIRYCRTIGDDAPEEGPQQRIALPAPEKHQLDGWDITSNNRFRKYITHRLMTQDPRAWGAPASTQQAECTRIAVRYKNAWAQDMRESDELDQATGEVIRASDELQDRAWIDCMRRAEADIEIYRKGTDA